MISSANGQAFPPGRFGWRSATGAPVLPVGTYFKEGRGHSIVMSPPIVIDEDVSRLCQRMADALGEVIRVRSRAVAHGAIELAERSDMRIALVSPYDLDVSGGVQAQVLGLQEELTERNHDVVVVGPASSVRLAGEWISSADFSQSARARSRAGTRLRVRRCASSTNRLCRSWGGVRSARSAPMVATFHADPSRLCASVYSSSAAGVGVERC